ncbi:MAG: alkaline phosphatase PafA [Bacteroidota bacterium]
MKGYLVIFFLLISTKGILAQKKIERPKLVVGIIVDQMRWDYLYRYYDRYDENGGFKRLLSKGFSCENTHIPYAQTVTACGHASIYTGSVPAINGITGNDWYDYDLNKSIYCTGDENTTTVGSTSENGRMSPKNLLVTTVCDELRLATNFGSKVIGIAIKDRGSVLPAGHSANAAYWYDNANGNWITSSYYMKKLPNWVTDFNDKKLVDQYYNEGWKTMYPPETYLQSDLAAAAKGHNVFGQNSKFPFALKQLIGKDYNSIAATPHGNTFTFEMAKAAMQGEQLGKDSITDFLAISLSSPDYIGHTFGPNSIEAEDNFLKLDQSLGQFLNHLDEQLGKDQYLVFLTSDHGVINVPSFLSNKNIPSGNFSAQKLFDELTNSLEEKFRMGGLLTDINNGQLFLNRSQLNKGKPNEKEVSKFIIDYLSSQPYISRAFQLTNLGETPLNATIKERVINGYYPSRSGDIQIIVKPQFIEGFEKSGTTHGSWYPYDSHIPLLWYGWKIKPGKNTRETSMADIAPTLSQLLHIQCPSGNVGKPITEITD